jgi:hypothetical protein
MAQRWFAPVFAGRKVLKPGLFTAPFRRRKALVNKFHDEF